MLQFPAHRASWGSSSQQLIRLELALRRFHVFIHSEIVRDCGGVDFCLATGILCFTRLTCWMDARNYTYVSYTTKASACIGDPMTLWLVRWSTWCSISVHLCKLGRNDRDILLANVICSVTGHSFQKKLEIPKDWLKLLKKSKIMQNCAK